jgi:maltose O-acetyltransferase
MGSEKDKMLAGELYRASDPQLVAGRKRCRTLLQAFNAEPDEEERLALLRELLGRIGSGSFIQPPFACDYGTNVSIGDDVFINFNAVILDCAPVTIGDGTQIGPGVQLLAADHPRDPQTRRDFLELARRYRSDRTSGWGRPPSCCRVSRWGTTRSSGRAA